MKIWHGKKNVLVILPSILVALLVGCKSLTPLPGLNNSKKYSTDISFGSDHADTTTLFPNELYMIMNHSIQHADFNLALFYYALAGSRSFFDASRINTQYARSMHNKILKQALASLSDDQRERFWKYTLAGMNDTVEKRIFCNKVKESGAPAYTATYMHVSASEQKTYKKTDSTQWKQAVDDYLLCPQI